MATAKEVGTVGQLVGICTAIVELTNAIDPLTKAAAIGDPAWRGEVLGRIGSLRSVVGLEDRLPDLPPYRDERAEIHAALEHLSQTLVIAGACVETENLPGFQLALTGRAKVAHRRLSGGLEALQAAIVARDHAG